MIDFLGKYLILESVEQQLTDAIKNHQTVSLYYKGNKGTPNPKTGKPMGKHKDFTASGLRYVIPVALGMHKSTGSVVLRALVTSKGVHTAGRDRPTKWRMFRIDRITSIYPHEDPNAINDAMPELYHYNDKDMSIIYAQADYGDKAQTTAPTGEPVPVQPAAPAQNLDLDKVPQGSKSVLKVPAAKQTPPPVQPKPQQPIKQPSPQPVPAPQPAPTTPPVAPPIAPTVTPPNMTEPTEPIGYNQPKPLKEWHIWLNKILNT
jgi:hypothetical protein